MQEGTLPEMALELIEELLDEMRQQGLEPNVTTYNAVISACMWAAAGEGAGAPRWCEAAGPRA